MCRRGPEYLQAICTDFHQNKAVRCMLSSVGSRDLLNMLMTAAFQGVDPQAWTPSFQSGPGQRSTTGCFPSQMSHCILPEAATDVLEQLQLEATGSLHLRPLVLVHSLQHGKPSERTSGS